MYDPIKKIRRELKKYKRWYFERALNHPILLTMYRANLHIGLQMILTILFIKGLISLVNKFYQSAAFQQMVGFINIWPIHQWISSLVVLILMYWFIGAWYNKKLSKEGGWISWKARVNMIALDLAINLTLGIYYMNARETLLGSIMLSCPIAISPVIFLIEFLTFIWYYRRYVLNKKDDEEEK